MAACHGCPLGAFTPRAKKIVHGGPKWVQRCPFPHHGTQAGSSWRKSRRYPRGERNMSILLAAAPTSLDVRLPDDPVSRLIFAVDIEGSTERTNLAKGKLRHSLYELLEQALEEAGIAARHLEP